MARSTKMRLRDTWLQVHKWIGLVLAILIIPISLTGSALVWHDALDEALNPQRHPASIAMPALTPSAYRDAAATALAPGERVSALRYEEGGAIVATAVAKPKRGAAAPPGPPQRTMVWLDPADGRVLDKASSNAGIVRAFHMIHGSIMVPGVGRQIVGWVGVAMFISCLTGIWLWWPVTGSVRRGFRWRRQNSTNANIHHLLGFWILIPLAMLSFTGFWISFPGVFGGGPGGPPQAAQGKEGGAKGGEGARAKGAERGGGNDRMRAMRAQPLERTAMTPEAALAVASTHATGDLVSIAWPTDQAAEWKIGYAREGGNAEVTVDDATGEVTPPKPPRPETLSRTMRRWHDGTGMGPLWQTIIFLGGIIPAVLSVTGIIMWLRNRGWRAALAKKRRGKLTPQPAE